MGQPPPPSDRRPAEDALDLIWVDHGTEETCYELATLVPRARGGVIRGSVLIRMSKDGKNGTLAIDGPAARYVANYGGQPR